MHVHMQARLRGKWLRDSQCVYCLLGLDQGRKRRHTPLLSTIRHHRRNHRVMHLHMRCRLWGKRMQDCRRMLRFLRFDQGWERWYFLLHKQRHCQRNSWVLQVHVQIRVQGFGSCGTFVRCEAIYGARTSRKKLRGPVTFCLPVTRNFHTFVVYRIFMGLFLFSHSASGNFWHFDGKSHK